MFTYLSRERLMELADALMETHLVDAATLDGLLEGVSPGYAASLPASGTPALRLVATLNRLNTVQRLADGSIPLQIWLENASLLTRPFDQNRIINLALSEVSNRGAGVGKPADDGARLAGRNERVVHADDMLPFEFLARGADAGRAVAFLEVPRYDDGHATMFSGSTPKTYLGTGWLLTEDLLITNHHVVNARDDGEPHASDGDLALQAEHLSVRFDFVARTSEVPPETVRSLEAWSPVDGPLDYAILRLTRRTDRKPLSLVRRALALPASPDSYPAVNIIQHPGGKPKMVALRNNLVTRATSTDLWYFTDTLGGSSGSPVLDDQWRVVALHKRWDFVQNVTYQGKATAWVNQGTQIAAILADLEATGKTALLAEINERA